jgi:hypothetical protein
MTPQKAAEIAGRAARRLNMPWSDADVVATRLLRLWPLARRWRVVSRVPSEMAETTILVEERSGRAFPQRVRHARSLAERIDTGSRPMPTFAEWLSLSDAERANTASGWNAYGGEGREILIEVTEDFRAKYGNIPGVEITGFGVYHGGSWVITVTHPFVFDRRLLPPSHLGIGVHTSSGHDLPPEFQDGKRRYSYVWAPPHYEQFVDRCADEIRRQLGRPDMSRDEILAALVGMPFEQFREHCRQSVREGRIAAFE